MSPTIIKGTSTETVTGNLETLHAVVEFLYDNARETTVKYHPAEKDLVKVIHDIFATLKDEFQKVSGGIDEDPKLKEQFHLQYFSHLNNKYIERIQRMLGVLEAQLEKKEMVNCLDEEYSGLFMSGPLDFCSEQLAYFIKISKCIGFTVLHFGHTIQFLGKVVTQDYMSSLLNGFENKLESVSESYKMLLTLFSESALKGDAELAKKFERVQQTLQLTSYYSMCLNFNFEKINNGASPEQMEWISESLYVEGSD